MFECFNASSTREELVALVGILANAAGYHWQANSTVSQHQKLHVEFVLLV